MHKEISGYGEGLRPSTMDPTYHMDLASPHVGSCQSNFAQVAQLGIWLKSLAWQTHLVLDEYQWSA